MTTLYNGTITTPGTVISGTVDGLYNKDVVGAAAVFDHGSSGTSAKAYLQTSYNDGESWIDVAAFAFTTSDANRFAALGRPTFGTATFVTTDGALADNTIAAAPIGDMVRCKLISTGTYAGTTTLDVSLITKRM